MIIRYGYARIFFLQPFFHFIVFSNKDGKTTVINSVRYILKYFKHILRLRGILALECGAYYFSFLITLLRLSVFASLERLKINL